jgi:hypothetical protein
MMWQTLFSCLVLLVLMSCAFTQEPHQPATPVYDLRNDTLFVTLDGYVKSCTEPVISVMADDGSWQPANNRYFLPDMGMLYLNDEYTGYMACDYVVCSPLGEPYRVPLQEYQLVGERTAPQDENLVVPVYQTNVLTGRLKVELEYYADEACQEKQLYSVIIDNE